MLTPHKMSPAKRILASDIQDPKQFWARVRKGPGCWTWLPHPTRKTPRREGPISYAAFCVPGQPNRPAHRVAYALTHGECPAKLLVRHRCDNKECVRPDHLELGTHWDNTQDAVRRGFLLKVFPVAGREVTPSRRATIQRRLSVHQKKPPYTLRKFQRLFGMRNSMWFARNNGLYGFSAPETISAIAADSAVSRERVRQVVVSISKRLGMGDTTFWTNKRL